MTGTGDGTGTGTGNDTGTGIGTGNDTGIGTAADQEAVRIAVDGQRRLLGPAVSASRTLAPQLLDPEFAEFGASGTCWDLQSVLASMSAESTFPQPPIKISAMSEVVHQG